MPCRMHRRLGFTLVELSIVLSIVALVVAGVMSGQKLLQAARLRSVIRHVVDTQTAAQAFQMTYQALPGDILSTRAASMGLSARNGLAGGGDGNGLIQYVAAANMTQLYHAGGETVLFWRDLSDTKMLSASFPLATNQPTNAPTSTDLRRAIFATDFRSNYVVAFSSLRVNYLQVQGVVSIQNGQYTLRDDLTPYEASVLDQKLDDGNPSMGYAQARTTGAPTGGTGSLLDNTNHLVGVNQCVRSSGLYNIAYTKPICGLRIQLQ